MTSSPDHIAAEFVTARRTQTPVAAPHAEELYDVHGAYLIQRRFVQQYATGSRRRIGYKLAATDERTQAALGIAEPVIGVLFSDDIHNEPAVVSRRSFNSMMAEAEVAIIVVEDLHELCSRDEVIAGTVVAPAIELADSRLLGWPDGRAQFSVQDVVADNALSGHLVVGETTPTADVDFTSLRARLTSDDRELTTSVPGRRPLDPVAMVGWLARAAHLLDGALPAGTIIATGAVAGPTPVDGEGLLAAELDGVGSVTATITS